MMGRTGVVDTRCAGLCFVGVRMHMMGRTGAVGTRCVGVGFVGVHFFVWFVRFVYLCVWVFLCLCSCYLVLS